MDGWMDRWIDGWMDRWMDRLKPCQKVAANGNQNELKQEARPCAKILQPLEDGLGFLSVEFNFFLGQSPTLAKNTIRAATRLQQHAHFLFLVHLKGILLEIVLDCGSTFKGTKCGLHQKVGPKDI
jgi:hypothetical protein